MAEDQPLSERLANFGIETAQAVLKPIEPVLDILSRPQYALSEAYGASEAGEEDLLSAAWRGLTKGRRRAKYGTFGEQLLPVQEGEDLGTKLARFGIEAVTDPLILAGGPLARGARAGVGVGLRATERLTRPARAAALQVPAAQSIARYTLPLSVIPRMFAPQAGGELAGLMKVATERATDRKGAFLQRLSENVRRYGLEGDPGRQRAVTRTLRGEQTSDPQVAGFANWLRSEMDEMKKELSEFVDPFTNQPFKIFDPKTKTDIPFAEGVVKENYVPDMFVSNLEEALEPYLERLSKMEAGRVKHLLERPDNPFSRVLAKQLKIPQEQAQRIIRSYAGYPQRVGHIERPKRGIDPMLEPLLEQNPINWSRRYMDKVIDRVETSKVLGVELDNLKRLLGQMQLENPGLSDDIVKDLLDWGRGAKPRSALKMDSFLRGVTAFQVLGKLGPTTTIANISQLANAMATEGIGNTLRGIGTALSRSPDRDLFMSSYLGGLRDHLQMVVGSADEAGRLDKYARRWLKLTGFERAEEINRVASAAAGTAKAEQLGRRALGFVRRTPGEQGWLDDVPDWLRKDLDKRGVTPGDLMDLRAGRFTDDAKRRIGLRASQKTQHATNYLELPPAWRTPEMRVLMQFKRFAYNQTRFLYEEVAQPAYRYFVSNGKEGSLAPLTRALAVYGPAGFGVSEAREQLRQLQASALGARRKRPSRTSFDKHPTLATLRNMMYVGSFGMLGDVAERASRGQLAGWLLGPTVSDVVDLSQRVAKAGQSVLYGEGGPTIEDLMLNAYRYGGRGALGISAPEMKTISTRRGLPGLVREGAEYVWPGQ